MFQPISGQDGHIRQIGPKSIHVIEGVKYLLPFLSRPPPYFGDCVGDRKVLINEQSKSC